MHEANRRKFTKQQSRADVIIVPNPTPSEELKTFCGHTSGHGFANAARAEFGGNQILWGLLILSCFIACFYHVVLLVNNFQKTKQSLYEIRHDASEVLYPNITICNVNPYKFSLAKETPPLDKTLMAYDEALKILRKKQKNTCEFSPKNLRPKPRSKRWAEDWREDFKKRIAQAQAQWDALKPAYVPCKCGENGGNCEAWNSCSTPTVNDTVCLCIYSTLEGERVLWPCYNKEEWNIRNCTVCRALGSCEYVKDGENQNPQHAVPCLCVR